jgi:hypothetical protein
LDTEYLEDYEQRENIEFERFLNGVQEGRLSFQNDKYPPDSCFYELHRPVVDAAIDALSELPNRKNIWAQIPLSGSLILPIPALPKTEFEELMFESSAIPQVIDFVKETGRLQVVLMDNPLSYKNLDYLDPFFKELKPPVSWAIPYTFLGNQEEINKADETFLGLAEIRFLDYIVKGAIDANVPANKFVNMLFIGYRRLKLGHFAIAEEVENLMVDDPAKALALLGVCSTFITEPLNDLRSDVKNYTFEELAKAQILPSAYRPKKIQFPCEIGKFLLRKLTHAAQDMRACYNLMDLYDSYDLGKVQKALNEGIVTNHPDIVVKSAEDVSEILEEIWNDKTIPNRIKNIEIGVPVSIAAVGGMIAGLPGLFAGGFLSELGFKVVEKATEKYAEKLFSVKGEGLTERLAKLRTKSYQANIYEFKKKYNKSD